MEWEHMKIVTAAVLLVCLFLVSVPFEQRYGDMMLSLAHNPGARFLAGLMLVYVASIDVALGGLALVVIFLWIADIQLLSSATFRSPQTSAAQ